VSQTVLTIQNFAKRKFLEMAVLECFLEKSGYFSFFGDRGILFVAWFFCVLVFLSIFSL
jgi:hypothetical protein